MSEKLPHNWAAVTLGDICSKPQYGWTCRAASRGNVKYVRTTDISNGRINWETVPFCEEAPDDLEKYRVQENDILVSRAGSVGVSFRIEHVPCDAVFASYLIRFQPLTGVHPKFVSAFLNSESYWRAISEFAAGIAVPNVNASKLASLELSLAPEREQRRIVAKLEALLAKVGACQQRLAKIPKILKRFRQSVLAAACSGRLTADWRELHSTESAAELIAGIKRQRTAQFQNSAVREDLDLPEIPDSWSWCNLRFVLSPAEAFCYGVVQPGEDDPDGVFLIRAGDLENDRVNTSSLRRIPKHIHDDYRRSQLSGGEVLVTVVGAGIGETAIAQPECAGFNIARAVAKLPVREFSARFVKLWLSTGRAIQWMKGDSREVARPTLNLEQLQTLPVPIPPLPEQHEIVRRVEALFAFADKIEARFAKAQAQVDRLTVSLLAKAFRGELVPQDPADEPASVILDRIQAERSATNEAAIANRKPRGGQ